MNWLLFLLLYTTLLGWAGAAWGQATGSISGRVTTTDGDPAEAVSVGLQGQALGSVTDGQGRYSILNAARTLALRLNTAYTYEDSFQNVDYPGFTRSVAVAPSLQFRPSDRLTINLDAEAYRGTNVGKQLIFFYYPSAQLGAARAEELPLDYRRSYQGQGLEQTSRSTNLFGQVRYQLSSAFTATTYLTTSRSYSNGFGPCFYLVPRADTSVNSLALARADQSTDNSRRTIYEAQQLFNGDFKLGRQRNRVVLGLDFLRLNSDVNFLGGALMWCRSTRPPTTTARASTRRPCARPTRLPPRRTTSLSRRRTRAAPSPQTCSISPSNRACWPPCA